MSLLSIHNALTTSQVLLHATPAWNKPLSPLQVVGEQEMKEQTVNVRTRDMETHGMHSLTDLTAKLLEENSTRSLVSAFKKSSGLHAHVGQPANQEPVAAAAVSAEAAQSDDHQLDKARLN